MMIHSEMIYDTRDNHQSSEDMSRNRGGHGPPYGNGIYEADITGLLYGDWYQAGTTTHGKCISQLPTVITSPEFPGIWDLIH